MSKASKKTKAEKAEKKRLAKEAGAPGKAERKAQSKASRKIKAAGVASETAPEMATRHEQERAAQARVGQDWQGQDWQGQDGQGQDGGGIHAEPLLGSEPFLNIADAEVVEDRPGPLHASSPSLSGDTAPDTAPDAALLERNLLERSRAHWQLGEWDRLVALADQPLETHPDRAKLALLTAVGMAQVGNLPGARMFARRAQEWGCGRDLLARVLVAGVHNSLGRVASLHRDEPRALRHFETSVATVSPRADAQVLGRARNIAEKARLGQLPEAARLLGEDVEALRTSLTPDRHTGEILKVQMDLLNHSLAQALRRKQLGPGETAATATLEDRSAAQLGQDLWVLERTGRKRGGFFVEFGATDGVLLSNTLMLERDFGWQGICAEPNPEFFEKLGVNRRCTVSSDCIMGETGKDVRFVLAAEYGGAEQHLGVDKHVDKRRPFMEAGRVIPLTSISLDDFLRKHGAPRDIDYLSIDTEGSEYEILSHFPFERWNIRLITVEHNFTPDRDRIRAVLAGHGYRVTEAKWDDWYEKDSGV